MLCIYSFEARHFLQLFLLLLTGAAPKPALPRLVYSESHLIETPIFMSIVSLQSTWTHDRMAVFPDFL